MSEDGWKAFLAADGVEDWVVLHGGAAAVFGVTSLGDGARLVAAIAAVEGLAGSGALVTVSDGAVSVRLTRDVWLLEAKHIDLARAVSGVAAELGFAGDRAAVQEVQLAIAARPHELDVALWRTVLGYDAESDDNGADPLGHSSVVWMQGLDPDKPLRHAMHIDVSLAREEALARVEAAVAAGATVVVDESPHTWILADRAGNKVCICAWPDGAPMD